MAESEPAVPSPHEHFEPLLDRLRAARLALRGAAAAVDELPGLRDSLQELDDQVTLAAQRHEEEALDVNRLEGWSLRRIAVALVGDRSSALDKERAEAQAAAAKLAQAQHQRDQAAAWLAAREEHAATAAAAEEALTQVALECATSLILISDPRGEALDRACRDSAEAERDSLSLTRVQDLAAQVARAMRRAWRLLRKADGWSGLDAIGGGLVTGMIKYDRMEQAKQTLGVVDRGLRLLMKELTEVGIPVAQPGRGGGGSGGVQVSMTLRGFDLFFDNLLSDILVGRRIQQSAQRLMEARKELLEMQQALAVPKREARDRMRSARNDRGAIIESLIGE